ncbi:MAG: hypothetical protein IJU70_11295 [Lentisphaeria bacterium]|nr:hypothetical protein [Lentisphaeria bacterium]
MPSIKIETSVVLSKAQEQALAIETGKIISALLNKPLPVIQVRVQSGMTMAFGGGIADDSAYISIALIGRIAPETRPLLPEKFTELLARSGVDPRKVFLNYVETDAASWGWI